MLPTLPPPLQNKKTHTEVTRKPWVPPVIASTARGGSGSAADAAAAAVAAAGAAAAAERRRRRRRQTSEAKRRRQRRGRQRRRQRNRRRQRSAVVAAAAQQMQRQPRQRQRQRTEAAAAEAAAAQGQGQQQWRHRRQRNRQHWKQGRQGKRKSGGGGSSGSGMIVGQIHQVFNSLTAKSVPAGTKNSCSLGRLFAGSHLKHTAHKHHNHDGAVCPSKRHGFVGRTYPTPGSLFARGWTRPPSKGFIRINKIKEKKIYFFSLSVNYNNRSPAVGNDSQNGIHCSWWATITYELTKDIVTDKIVAHFSKLTRTLYSAH